MKLKLNFLNNDYILINVFEENIAWFKFFQNLKNSNNYIPTIQTDGKQQQNNDTTNLLHTSTHRNPIRWMQTSTTLRNSKASTLPR
jgi:hypothetical protein